MINYIWYLTLNAEIPKRKVLLFAKIYNMRRYKFDYFVLTEAVMCRVGIIWSCPACPRSVSESIHWLGHWCECELRARKVLGGVTRLHWMQEQTFYINFKKCWKFERAFWLRIFFLTAGPPASRSSEQSVVIRITRALANCNIAWDKGIC